MDQKYLNNSLSWKNHIHGFHFKLPRPWQPCNRTSCNNRAKASAEVLTQYVWLDFLKMYASVIYVNVHFSEDSFLGIHQIFTGVHAKNKGYDPLG